MYVDDVPEISRACIQRERSHLVTSPRGGLGDVYIPSLSVLPASSRKVNSSLSPPLFLSRACHDCVNGFYCSFAVIVEYTPALSFSRRLIFHRLSSPGRTRFLGTESRNPTARFLPAQNKTRPVLAGTRSPRNPVVTRRSIRI